LTKRNVKSWLTIAAVSVVATCLVLPGAAAARTRRIPAHFVDLDLSTGDNCGHAVGIQFTPVPGAESYSISYWDGYYKVVEHATVTPAVLASDQAPHVGAVPESEAFYPVSGASTAHPARVSKPTRRLAGASARGPR
jgi:hypothetical protein